MTMPHYNPQALLPDDQPGPWSTPVEITYTQRDVLLYAVGIGCADLRFAFEQHPQFAVFPTFAIRWGAAGLVIDPAVIPHTPGPLMLDAERLLEHLAPLPTEGTVTVRSRLISAQPRGKGNAFVECQAEVLDTAGQVCVRMVSGTYRRGVVVLGDIEPFVGAGISQSSRIPVPTDRAADFELTTQISAAQANIYRLSGDYNPLHIDPAAAAIGGFTAPILHGLCTYGHCGQMLLGALCAGDPARFGALKVRFSSPVYPGDTLRLLAWHAGPGRVVFEAKVGETTVVNNAYFNYL